MKYKWTQIIAYLAVVLIALDFVVFFAVGAMAEPVLKHQLAKDGVEVLWYHNYGKENGLRNGSVLAIVKDGDEIRFRKAYPVKVNYLLSSVTMGDRVWYKLQKRDTTLNLKENLAEQNISRVDSNENIFIKEKSNLGLREFVVENLYEVKLGKLSHMYAVVGIATDRDSMPETQWEQEITFKDGCTGWVYVANRKPLKGGV